MQYGRGLDRSSTDTFVGMYVNDLTLDYGERGRTAVLRLLGEAAEKRPRSRRWTSSSPSELVRRPELQLGQTDRLDVARSSLRQAVAGATYERPHPRSNHLVQLPHAFRQRRRTWLQDAALT